MGPDTKHSAFSRTARTCSSGREHWRSQCKNMHSWARRSTRSNCPYGPDPIPSRLHLVEGDHIPSLRSEAVGLIAVSVARVVGALSSSVAQQMWLYTRTGAITHQLSYALHKSEALQPMGKLQNTHCECIVGRNGSLGVWITYIFFLRKTSQHQRSFSRPSRAKSGRKISWIDGARSADPQPHAPGANPVGQTLLPVKRLHKRLRVPLRKFKAKSLAESQFESIRPTLKFKTQQSLCCSDI